MCESACGEGKSLDGRPVGCGEPVWLDRGYLGYRCADCDTVFCKPCIRRHFGWHADEKTDATNQLRVARKLAHELVDLLDLKAGP